MELYINTVKRREIQRNLCKLLLAPSWFWLPVRSQLWTQAPKAEYFQQQQLISGGPEALPALLRNCWHSAVSGALPSILFPITTQQRPLDF